jgi:selenide,water dikinase
MAKGSGLSASLKVQSISFLPEVLALAEQGFVPAGAYANRNSYANSISYIEDVDLSIMDLLFDPQTAGGLLMAVKPSDVKALCLALGNEGIQATEIGMFKNGQPGKIEVSN